MGTGASKATPQANAKVGRKQPSPARSKLRAVAVLAKQGAVEAEGVKNLTIETLWPEPRHERGKWRELLEKNLLDFAPFPLDKTMVDELLGGKTLQTKASAVRIVRVFISSTFTDTAQERNLLIADVYPYLKLFGRKYGFEFASSEMRWGIREESSSDHMTSIICMAEITRCQKESQGINYVVCLCDKYGFRPFPARIEENEFDQLQAQAKKDNDPDEHLLNEWFDLNTNVVPPTYMLKPSTQAPQGKWWDIFEKLQMTLRKASRCLKDKERAKWYTVSVTEEEVHRGLLYMDNRDQNTFFYRRRITNLENHFEDKIAGKFIDKKYSDGSIDSEAQTFLHKLKNETVPGVLKASNIKDYTVNWGPGITLEQHADYLREFSDHFCNLMIQSMSEAIKGSHVAEDALFEEVKTHAVFCLEKAEQVFGKEEILKKISSYLESNSSHPLVVHGPSGSGKTSIIAKGIANAVSSSSGAALNYRFLGTSMDSTAARPLLRSLCVQLRRIYSKDPNDVATDFKTLCEEFLQNLQLVSKGQSLILFLDSLDQLTDEDNGRNLEWLPLELPSNVKIVVSTLPKEGGCLNKLRLSLPEEAFVEVTKMSANDGRYLLESWLKASNRSLTASQMLEVLDSFNGCPYPLFLKIAFETSCTWTSFTSDDEISLSRTVRAVIDDMFDKLIRIHGNLLVNHALGYLTVAKFGLTANELEDILSCDDEVLNDVYEWWVPPVRRLPPLLWVRIQTDLGPYLVERGLKGGTPVLSWYHRQFREAAEEKFVSDPEIRKARHSAIAEYFIGRWAGQAIPYVGKDGLSRTADRKVASQPLVLNEISPHETSSKNRQYNMRKLTELPTALIGAKRWQLFLESICSIPFVEAKCQVGLVYELINETKQAETLARSSGSHQVALSLKEFAQMLSESVQVLNQYPECTIQQAANFPDSSAPAKAAQGYLASLTSKPHWLCHVNKPQELSAKVLSLNWGKFSGSQSIVFSPDGRQLCCGTNSETGHVFYLTIWDVETGALLMTVPSEDARFYRVLYSPDGRHVACGMNKAEVRLLDSNTGAQVKNMTIKDKDFKKRSDVQHLDFSPDGKYLAAGYENCYVVIWDVQKCEEFHRLVTEEGSNVCHDSKISSLRFTPNGRYLWSVEEQGIHKTWDVQDNYNFVAKGSCTANWYDEDEGDKFEGQIPGGLFTGHYEMEFPEGNNGDASFPIMFWDDGTLSGEGKDEQGDYTIRGTYDLANRTMKFVQEQYIASAEYDLQLEFTPDTEDTDGTCHIWGPYVIPTWVGTYKGTIDMRLSGPYPKKAEDEAKDNLNRAWSGDVSSDSRLAVTANDDCTLKIFSIQGENEAQFGRRKSIRLGEMVTWIRYSTQGGDPKDVRFHPTNPDLVYGCSAHGSVCGFSVLTRKQVAEYVHGSVIQTMAISYDGGRLVSLCDGDSIDVLVWDTAATGEGEQSLHGGDTKAMEISALEFSHDGSKLAAVINNCDYVQVLETKSGKLLTSIKFYTSSDNCCFSLDDTQLFVSKAKDLVVFTVNNGNEVDRFKSVYGYETGRACFSPQGQLAVQGLEQRYTRSKIKVFSYPQKQLVQQFDELSDSSIFVPCISFSQDGSKLYSVGSERGYGNFVTVLCMETGNVLQTFKPKKEVYRFCLDVSHTKCLIGSGDGNVYVVDVESGKTLLEIQPQTWRINGISSFRVDGQDYIVSGCEDRSFKILDINTGLQVGHMTSPQGVSATAATTIPGTNRPYVAVGDQGAFVRILQWM